MIEVLLDLTKDLTIERPLEESLRLVTEAAVLLVGADHASIRLLDASRSSLLAGARSGTAQDARPLAFKTGEGVIGWVVEHEEGVAIDDVNEDDRFVTLSGQGFVVRSMVAEPLWSSGEVIGVISVSSPKRAAFGEEAQLLVRLLANCSVPPVERARLKRLGTSAQPMSVDGGRSAQASADTTGRVALFATCYGNRNEPALDEDLDAVFEHNAIEMTLLPKERCCGMPRLELGDLEAVAKLKEANIPQLAAAIAAGYDIVAPIPSCVLMFKQELPLMYPEDAAVKQVAAHVFDPFEYLLLRHAAGLLRTDFKGELGTVSYHVACHLRVQNLGLKTRDVLKLIPGTTVDVIERCSGHNGTYGVKKEFRAASVKIGRPVAQRVASAKADHYSSDCPMAGHQIESILGEPRAPEHPLKLLRLAYGL
jgi:Fe-S oxidoreductase